MEVTALRPRRPWWKRKRTWTAVALTLAVAYPAGSGPAAYAVGRGWVSPEAFNLAYDPLDPLWPQDVAATPTLYTRYFNWWWDLANRHAASD